MRYQIHRIICVRLDARMHVVVVLQFIWIGYLLSIDNGNQFPFYLLPTLLFFLSSLLFSFGLSTFPAVRALIASDNRIGIGSRSGNQLQLSFLAGWFVILICILHVHFGFWQSTIYVFLRAPIDRQIDFCSSMMIINIRRTLLEGIVGIGDEGKMNCCLSVCLSLRMQQAICIIYLLLEMST